MLKILRRAFLVVIGILTLPLISIFLQAIFKLNISESMFNYYITIALGIALMLILRNKKFYTIPLIVVLALAVILCLKKYYEYRQFTSIETTWVHGQHRFSIPFYTAPSGHIFIKVNVNGQNGYMGFDTGADITGIRENIDKSFSEVSTKITDSQGNTNNMNLSLLDSLSIGNLCVNKMSYMPMPNEAWERCGIFYSQDSIVGVLGNNVINHFVWEFDMINKKIQLSETAPIFQSDKNETVYLSKTGMNSWQITLSIGGEKRDLKLDTGSDQCLTIQDTLNFSKTFSYTSPNYTEHKGLFSYMDCSGNKQQVDTTARIQRKVFADIQINNSPIRNVYVNDKQASNLLGIPLIWEYERVIFDFPNHKIHLIRQNTVNSLNGFTQKSHNQIRAMKRELISSQGYFQNNYHDTLEIRGLLSSKHDTISYNLVGLTKTYGHLESSKHVIIDSILCVSDDSTIRSSEFIPLNYDFFNEL